MIKRLTGADPVAFVPRKRLPDWASLELSPSVESCGCGLVRAEQGTSLETPSRARASSCQAVALMGEPRGFSRVSAGFSSYDVEFRLPIVLALGSPIFNSICEGDLAIAL